VRECYGVAPTSIEDSIDPEYPSMRSRVITVFVRGAAEELVERSMNWHRRMIDEIGSAGDYITICVEPE
jgi:hypothetical protein